MTTTPASIATSASAAASTASTRSLGDLLARHQQHVYVALRVLTGLLFSFHGAQKLFDWFMPPGIEIPVGSQVWIGSIIELATGLLIASGRLLRPAAFLASGTMAVAYIQFHWKLAFDAQFLPAVNGGEPALVFAVLFLFFACRGK